LDGCTFQRPLTSFDAASAKPQISWPDSTPPKLLPQRKIFGAPPMAGRTDDSKLSSQFLKFKTEGTQTSTPSAFDYRREQFGRKCRVTADL
jgi:hypothetical protein